MWLLLILLQNLKIAGFGYDLLDTDLVYWEINRATRLLWYYWKAQEIHDTFNSKCHFSGLFLTLVCLCPIYGPLERDCPLLTVI